MCCDNIHPAICLQLICEGIYLLHSRIKRHRVRFFPVFVGYLIRKVLRKSHLALFFLSGNCLFYPFADFGNHFFFSAPETHRFDVRIIAIADDNLYKKVEKGTFLRELFHLLSASELQTVPIRRRREDIPDLLNYFLLQFFHNSDMTCDRIFSEGLLRFLKEYAYPGNIHELYNLSCSLFTRYNSHKLQLSDLPTYLRSRQMADVSLTDLQYQVLSFVSTHPKAGRLAIKNGLADGETFVSEAALRTVLGELSSAGYLIVHRTKGGCEISELGRMVLEK